MSTGGAAHDSIRQWLAGIGLQQYAEAFECEQIDADSAAYLTDANLKDLGLPMGPRARFLAASSGPL